MSRTPNDPVPPVAEGVAEEPLTETHPLPAEVWEDLRWAHVHHIPTFDLFAMLFDGDRSAYLTWA